MSLTKVNAKLNRPDELFRSETRLKNNASTMCCLH